MKCRPSCNLGLKIEQLMVTLVPTWHQLMSIGGQLGANLGQLGVNLGPTWVNLGQLEPTWHQLGTNLGTPRAHFMPLAECQLPVPIANYPPFGPRAPYAYLLLHSPPIAPLHLCIVVLRHRCINEPGRAECTERLNSASP